MPTDINPLAQFQHSLIDSAIAVTCHSLDAVSRLRQLNLQALKATVEESGEQLAKALLANDVSLAATASTDWNTPIGAKTQSYFHHLQTIATEAGTEIAKEWEQQVAASGKALQAMVGSMTAEAPAGRPIGSVPTNS